MSRNGSGTFLVNSTGNPVVSGTSISSTWANALSADLATGLTQSICVDGQTPTTGLIPFSAGLKTTTVNEFTSTNGVALQGTTSNPPTNASAGYVGEYIETIVLDGAAFSVSNGVDTSIMLVSLPPGDWHVWGNAVTSPAGSTTTSVISCGINIFTNTLPSVESRSQISTTVAAGQRISASLSGIRISTSTTINVYLVANITFAVSTMGVCGFLKARRLR